MTRQKKETNDIFRLLRVHPVLSSPFVVVLKHRDKHFHLVDLLVSPQLPLLYRASFSFRSFSLSSPRFLF